MAFPHWRLFMHFCTSKTEASGEFAGIDPSLEEIDLRLWPGPITGHRPGTESGVDRVSVGADGVVRPEIELGRHGLLVFFPEQGFDVFFETDGFSLGTTVGH
jgi:hypothetical protein